ncbi:MAG: L-histidine N(alpha)-methyltransferase [Acidobacteriota bacterium]
MKRSSNNRIREGIRDWPAKRSFLRGIYNEVTDTGLVASVVDNWVEKHEKKDVTNQFYDTFRRWGDSRPTSRRSQDFWDWIIKNHCLNVRAPQLWTCSISQFISYFPPSEADVGIAVGQLIDDPRSELDNQTRRILRKRFIEDFEGKGLYNAQLFPEYTFNLSENVTFEGPHTGIPKGQIQHFQFYTVPEAAMAWKKLVDSENYRLYLDCLVSLEMVSESDIWLERISDGRHNVAIVLGGGGSPEKDWIIAKSLLRATDRLDLYITDISLYMLKDSARVLQRRISKMSLEDRLIPQYKIYDFLKLDEQMPRAESWESVIWVLVGGSMGNVPNERDFFRSINGPSRTGDLLIVGIDTFSEETDEELADRMVSQYKSKELDSLLLTPLLGRLEETDKNNDCAVEVKLIGEHHENPLSEVPHSRTAVFFTNVDNGRDSKEVILASSTRYTIRSFLDYAKRFGWRHLTTARASESSTYSQVLLEKFR